MLVCFAIDRWSADENFNAVISDFTKSVFRGFWLDPAGKHQFAALPSVVHGLSPGLNADNHRRDSRCYLKDLE